jgi:hypothetical protein
LGKYSLEPGAGGCRKGLKHILKFNVRQVGGDAVDELAKQGVGANKGKKRIPRAALDGMDCIPDQVGQILGMLKCNLDQVFEFGRR